MENSSLIAVMKEEVAEYKYKSHLEQQVVKLHDEMKALTEKCNEQERYKRRQNLCSKGLKEKESEDLRSMVTSLLSKIAPGVLWNVDDMECG